MESVSSFPKKCPLLMCVVLEETVEIVVHYFGNIIVGSNKND